MLAKRIGAEPDFRWRGHEVSRIEGLSDGVFAIAVTLLIVSLEVPKTFAELMSVLRGLPAFAICFSILMWIWWEQYKFFRRYALQDTLTVVLNLALLFVVLFYIYPLKFTFTGMMNQLMGAVTSPPEATQRSARILFLAYGLGFMAVFGILAALHLHALALKQQLELDELEIFATRASVSEHALLVGIGALSLVVSRLGDRWLPYAGLVYFLIGVVETIHGMVTGRQRRLLEQRLRSAKAPSAT